MEVQDAAGTQQGNVSVKVSLMNRGGLWTGHGKTVFPTEPQVPPAFNNMASVGFCDPDRGLEPTDDGKCACMKGACVGVHVCWHQALCVGVFVVRLQLVRVIGCFKCCQRVVVLKQGDLVTCTRVEKTAVLHAKLVAVCFKAVCAHADCWLFLQRHPLLPVHAACRLRHQRRHADMLKMPSGLVQQRRGGWQRVV